MPRSSECVANGRFPVLDKEEVDKAHGFCSLPSTPVAEVAGISLPALRRPDRPLKNNRSSKRLVQEALETEKTVQTSAPPAIASELVDSGKMILPIVVPKHIVGVDIVEQRKRISQYSRLAEPAQMNNHLRIQREKNLSFPEPSSPRFTHKLSDKTPRISRLAPIVVTKKSETCREDAREDIVPKSTAHIGGRRVDPHDHILQDELYITARRVVAAGGRSKSFDDSPEPCRRRTTFGSVSPSSGACCTPNAKLQYEFQDSLPDLGMSIETCSFAPEARICPRPCVVGEVPEVKCLSSHSPEQLPTITLDGLHFLNSSSGLSEEDEKQTAHGEWPREGSREDGSKTIDWIQKFDQSSQPEPVRVVNPTASMCISMLFEDLKRWAIPFNDIQLGPKIGSGSFSEVFEGFWNGRKVAVKIYLMGEDKTFSDRSLQVFRKEVEIMSQLSHNTVCEFIGACTTFPDLAVVMAYYPKGSLEDAYRDRVLFRDFQSCHKVALGIARGLEYMHSVSPPIVHRDLKAGNIFLMEDGSVKIGDFGISTAVAEPRPLTQCGTLKYMAPEIMRGENASEKVDIFSFGILLYELVFRKRPYEEINSNAFVVAMQAAYAGLRPSLDHCPFPEFLSLIEECWAESPAHRPAASEIVRRLQCLAC